MLILPIAAFVLVVTAIALDLRAFRREILKRVAIERFEGAIAASDAVSDMDVRSTVDFSGRQDVKVTKSTTHRFFVQLAPDHEVEINTGPDFTARPGHRVDLLMANSSAARVYAAIVNKTTGASYEFTPSLIQAGLQTRSMIASSAPYAAIALAATLIAIFAGETVVPKIDRYGTRDMSVESAIGLTVMAGILIAFIYARIRRDYVARRVRAMLSRH